MTGWWSRSVIVALAAVSLTAAADSPSPAIQAAIADPARPAADVARDADRRPAAVLAFAGVKPGDIVADYAAGSGYFTRLFGGIVGARGHVHAVVPGELLRFAAITNGAAEIGGWTVAHRNVSLAIGSAAVGPRFPQRLDLFWIAQNYHDLRNPFMGPVDMAAFNRAVFDALKPGGIYVVLDHAAAAGAPADVSDTLHRIDPAVVRREVEAAGFRFVGESRVLANPGDPRTAAVQDPSIRGRTDQFLLKFRRP